MQSDLGLIIAIVGTGLGIIVAMISLSLWVRSEANSDRRYLQDGYSSNKDEIYRIERRLEKLLRNRR